MKNIFFVIASVLFSCTVFGQQFKFFDITHMGAKGDGQTDNTVIIQRAIDSAAASGDTASPAKGFVTVPKGIFVTGVLHLKSGVTLTLEKGAVLLASTRRSDYGGAKASALLVADNQKFIAVSGEGVIDGRGREVVKDIYRMLEAGTLQDPEWKIENPWHQKRPIESNRPGLIDFRHCEGVFIKGVTLKDAACWVQTYTDCTLLEIDSIRVESTAYWNNDGIDIVDCRDVKVTNSFVNAADDGICLKSHSADGRCFNVVIDNCTVRSSASAIKFGTASLGGFRHISVSNITVYDTYRSAIALESVDGGVIEKVEIRHIRAKNTGNAIFIRLGHRRQNADIGKIDRVLVSDVQVEVPAGKPDKGYEMEGPEVMTPHNIFPASITGLPGHPVEGVILENITIMYPGGGKKDRAYVGLDTLDRIPEKEADYPEFSMFGELPAWGLYVRHVAGLRLKNVSLRYRQDDFRPAAVFDDVQGLTLDDLTVHNAQTAPVLVLKNVSGFEKNGGKLPFEDQKAIRALF